MSNIMYVTNEKVLAKMSEKIGYKVIKAKYVGDSEFHVMHERGAINLWTNDMNNFEDDFYFENEWFDEEEVDE